MNLLRSLCPAGRLLGLACLLSALSACQAPKAPPGLDNPDVVVGQLKVVNPRDIVVLPVQNSTGRTDIPLEALREEFHTGLVELRYSPLSLDYVDSRVVEAAYTPGTLEEQGTLQIFITDWNDGNWRSHSRLEVEADVYLLDGRDEGGAAPLWGGTFKRTVDLSRRRQAFPTDQALKAEALREYARGVLASLPARNPEKF